MTDLRTALLWLWEQNLSPDAEVWVLSDSIVHPVTGLSIGQDSYVVSCPVWSDPPPVPLSFAAVYDSLLDGYAGGGSLRWWDHVTYTYRGSYTVNPDNAVFLLFLPEGIQLLESHSEKMEQRKQQARQLTQEIENSWQHSQ